MFMNTFYLIAAWGGGFKKSFLPEQFEPIKMAIEYVLKN